MVKGIEMGEKKSLLELNDEVNEGIEIAKEAAGEDEELLETIYTLERAWNKLLGQIIIMSVGLTAMKYREDEQIRELLRIYKRKIGGLTLFSDWMKDDPNKKPPKN